jgi:hypothetical protein
LGGESDLDFGSLGNVLTRAFLRLEDVVRLRPRNVGKRKRNPEYGKRMIFRPRSMEARLIL